MNEQQRLEPIDIFRLGQAHGAFSVGELDQGVHQILPTLDGDNSRLQSFVDDYLDMVNGRDAESCMAAVEQFLVDHDVLTEDQAPWAQHCRGRR